jgi:hypothetical protein
MAYINKKSAKRKHRRHGKKGGVVTFVDHKQGTRKKQHANKKGNMAARETEPEPETIQNVANDYTRGALENALSIFSREQQAPTINVTVHGKSRAQSKRQGPTPGQIKKAEQKVLKEAEKAAKKAAKKVKQEEEKVAKEVTKAAVSQAFSSMFGKGTGPKSRKRK